MEGMCLSCGNGMQLARVLPQPCRPPSPPPQNAACFAFLTNPEHTRIPCLAEHYIDGLGPVDGILLAEVRFVNVSAGGSVQVRATHLHSLLGKERSVSCAVHQAAGYYPMQVGVPHAHIC